MTIVIKNGRYYIPFLDGLKEISPLQANQLYEEDLITNVEEYEHD